MDGAAGSVGYNDPSPGSHVEHCKKHLSISPVRRGMFARRSSIVLPILFGEVFTRVMKWVSGTHNPGMQEVHSQDQPDRPGGAAVYHHRHVQPEGQLDRYRPTGRGAYHHPAPDLLRGHVPGQLRHGKGGRGRLQENHHTFFYGCQQQQRAGHRRGGGGVWDQFRESLHGRHRPAGRGAGDDRPGQRGLLAAEEVFRCLRETQRQSQAYSVENINQSSLASLWN
jgi:hypothetical protein